MAGSVIGALRVNLGLDSANFEKGAKGVNKPLSAMAKRMKAVSSAAIKMGTIMTAASTGLALAVKRQIDVADDMSKAAAKFGVPIETLSKLKYAADLSGVSLETMGTGLQKLSQKMVAVSNGNKGAIALFDEMGISATNLDGSMRKTEDVLSDVSDVLSKMPDGAEKTALAMKVFGKSGAELIPMLNGGSGAIRDMMAEAESLGIVIDEKTGKAAEGFNDNISRISAAIGGLVVQFTAALAPTMEQISGKLVEMTKWFRDLSPETQELAAKIALIAAATGPLILGFGLVIGPIGAVISAMGALTAVMLANPFVLVAAAAVAAATLIYLNWDKITAYFTQLWADVKAIAIAGWEAIKSAFMNYTPAGLLYQYWDEIPGYFSRLIGRVSEAFVAGWEAIRAEVSTWPARFVEFGGQIVEGLKKGIADKWDSMVASVAAKGEALKTRFKSVFGIKSPSRVFKGYGQNITEGLAIGISDKMPMVGSALDEMGNAIDGGGNSLIDRLADFKSAAGNAFTSFVTGSKTARQALGDLASSMAQALANQAFEGIWGALSGGIGGGGGGFLGKIFGFANGTNYAPGGMALVGERGPELVNLPRGSQVHTAQKTKGMMQSDGGQTVIRLELSRDIEARILQQSGAQAVQLVQVNNRNNARNQRRP